MSVAPDEAPPELVDVPMTQLAPDTLQALVESFVLREGTDYGEQEGASGDEGRAGPQAAAAWRGAHRFRSGDGIGGHPAGIGEIVR